MHALTMLQAWYTSCILLSCQEQSYKLCTAWRIFSSDTLECLSSFPSWMGWAQECWLQLIDWEESLEDSLASLSWAFLRCSLPSWTLILSWRSLWTHWSSWLDPISLPSLDGNQDWACLLARITIPGHVCLAVLVRMSCFRHQRFYSARSTGATPLQLLLRLLIEFL